MYKTDFFSKPSKAGGVLTSMLLLMLTGCGPHVDKRGASVTVASPAVEVQDDYVYYPDYEIYYSSSRHQYASFHGGAWISEPAPRGVSIAMLRASRSVKMDFHDAPANHHAAIVRQYPKATHPARANQVRKNGQQDEDRGGK